MRSLIPSLSMALSMVGCTMTEAATPPVETVVSGVIRLAPDLQRLVGQDDLVLIIARRSPAAPPLAMKKVPVSSFPLSYALLLADVTLEEPLRGSVDVMVRVDKDKNPYSRSKGDLVGRLAGVSIGAHSADVLISEVLP